MKLRNTYWSCASALGLTALVFTTAAGQTALRQLATAPDETTLITLHQELNIPRGDVDVDGSVGFPDFLRVTANYGLTANGYEDGDFNLDGVVDLGDYAILSINFGNGAYVAEPDEVPPMGNLGLWLNGDGKVVISSASSVAIGGIEVVAPNGNLTPTTEGSATPFPFDIAMRNEPELVAWTANPGRSVDFEGDLVSEVSATPINLSISWFEPGNYSVFSRALGAGDAMTGRPIQDPDPPEVGPPQFVVEQSEAIQLLNEAPDVTALVELHQGLGIPRGDVDGNGRIEFIDFLAFSSRFGEPAENYGDADFNLDGVSDIEDFAILSTNFSILGFLPDPPSVERVDLSASVNGEGKLIITSAGAVELGGVEVASPSGGLMPGPEQQGQLLPFVLQQSEQAVVWGHLGATVRLDGDWTTNVGIQDGTADLSLRWFQRGSYEVFSTSPASSIGGLVGDIDGNGDVAFLDFLILSANFGSPVATFGEGDLNDDGHVDFADFLLLSTNFGKSAATVATVPEPTRGVLFLLGTLAFAGLRRRHGFQRLAHS